MIAIRLRDECDTDRLGQAFATCLPAGCTVNLNGTLGAGKTRLIKSFGQALGYPVQQIVSPTFTLCNEYVLEHIRLNHLDLYRIADEDELLEIGLEEYCGSANSITLIEWGDRYKACLPDERIDLQFDIVSTDARRVVVRVVGHELLPLLDKLTREAERLQLDYEPI